MRSFLILSFSVISVLVGSTSQGRIQSISTKLVSDDPFFVRRMKRTSKILLALNENSLTQSISNSLKDSDNDQDKVVSITAQLGYSQALYDQQDGSRARSYDYLLSPSAKISEKYSLGALVTASTDANNQKGSEFGRARLLLARKPLEWTSSTNILKSWNFSPLLGLNLPAGRDARDNQSFLYGINPELSFGPNSSALGSERWSLLFNLRVSRNFHTYEISKSGDANSQYSSAQTITVGYLLPRNFSLEFSFLHLNSWSYEGNQSEALGHSQELAFKANSHLNFSLGHQFGSPGVRIYGPDGQTLNLSIANEKYSSIYTNMTLLY